MKRLVVLLVFILTILAWLAQTATAADCRQSRPGLATVPVVLNGNITVGRDVPVGTEVYRYEYSNNYYHVTLDCQNVRSGDIIENRTALVTGAPLAWYFGPYAGRVFASGVPGIGVIFYATGLWVPENRGPAEPLCPNQSSCSINLGPIGRGYMALVKTGNEVGSGTVRGQTLPTYNHTLFHNGTTFVTQQVTFSGSINVISRTCQTPNVQVDMGARKVSEFNEANSATPWKDFVILLNNCPAFYGTNPSLPNTQWSVSNTNMGLNGPNLFAAAPHKSNSLAMSLTGTAPLFDAGRGIFSLNPAGTGQAGAATGIGVQLASVFGTPLEVGPDRWMPIITGNRDGGSILIPMKARYVRTTGPVGAGQANATVQFTLNYQ